TLVVNFAGELKFANDYGILIERHAGDHENLAVTLDGLISCLECLDQNSFLQVVILQHGSADHWDFFNDFVRSPRMGLADNCDEREADHKQAEERDEG